jgi:hypothetical protein
LTLRKISFATLAGDLDREIGSFDFGDDLGVEGGRFGDICGELSTSASGSVVGDFLDLNEECFEGVENFGAASTSDSVGGDLELDFVGLGEDLSGVDCFGIFGDGFGSSFSESVVSDFSLVFLAFGDECFSGVALRGLGDLDVVGDFGEDFFSSASESIIFLSGDLDFEDKCFSGVDGDLDFGGDLVSSTSDLIELFSGDLDFGEECLSGVDIDHFGTFGEGLDSSSESVECGGSSAEFFRFGDACFSGDALDGLGDLDDLGDFAEDLTSESDSGFFCIDVLDFGEECLSGVEVDRRGDIGREFPSSPSDSMTGDFFVDIFGFGEGFFFGVEVEGLGDFGGDLASSTSEPSVGRFFSIDALDFGEECFSGVEIACLGDFAGDLVSSTSESAIRSFSSIAFLSFGDECFSGVAIDSLGLGRFGEDFVSVANAFGSSFGLGFSIGEALISSFNRLLTSSICCFPFAYS